MRVRDAGRAYRAAAVLRGFVDRAIVRWCLISGDHFIEPWIGSAHPPLMWAFQRAGSEPPIRIVSEHSGCESCTWCEDCGRLLGREEVPRD